MLLNRRPKFFGVGMGVPMNHTLWFGAVEGSARATEIPGEAAFGLVRGDGKSVLAGEVVSDGLESGLESPAGWSGHAAPREAGEGRGGASSGTFLIQRERGKALPLAIQGISDVLRPALKDGKAIWMVVG